MGGKQPPDNHRLTLRQFGEDALLTVNCLYSGYVLVVLLIKKKKSLFYSNYVTICGVISKFLFQSYKVWLDSESKSSK